MAKKTKVVINRASFGRNVMAGPGVSAAVERLAERVAAQVEHGEVQLSVSPVREGGSRVRAHISNGTTDAQEARTNELTTALMNTTRSV